jgi:hypothetical protein
LCYRARYRVFSELVAVANYLHSAGVSVTLKAGVSRLGNPGFGVASNRRVDVSWK